MTPVVVQIVPVRELIFVILSTTGKDHARVREVLAKGAVVQGGSRFRWESLIVEPPDLQALLATFPDADPARPFHAALCTGVRIRSNRHVIELPREIASQTKLFRRRSFWDVLTALALRSPLEYLDYSYRTRTHDYRLMLSAQDTTELQEGARLLRHSGLAAQIRGAAIHAIEFTVRHE